MCTRVVNACDVNFCFYMLLNISFLDKANVKKIKKMECNSGGKSSGNSLFIFMW